MPLPKNYKYDRELYNKLEGPDNRQDNLNEISDKMGYLPQPIDIEDMDISMVEFINDKLVTPIDGVKKEAKIYSITRWNELYKNFDNLDSSENIKLPFYAIVKNRGFKKGTIHGGFSNIPGIPTYNYTSIPVWDGNKMGSEIYKIHQPFAVDLEYTLMFITNKTREINKVHENIIRSFSSKQDYIKCKGHFMPVKFEEPTDNSENSVDVRRFYKMEYNLTLQGYILNEDDFEVVKGFDRVVTSLEVDEPRTPTRDLKESSKTRPYDLDYSLEYKKNSANSLKRG